MANLTDVLAITECLAAICGSEHVRMDEATLNIAPANTEEVAAVLRYANNNCISVSACGGGTKQSWGSPSHFSVALKTRRLSTVREHAWQDMTCIVEAGCTWSAMQQALQLHGQFIALDPLWPSRATVGGVVATNDSGSLRLRYGSLRDLVIGMTIVLADGTIARSGGKVVKNVAGYDLHKLMTGAFGTLGIITAVGFRLHSIPRHTQSFMVPSPHVEPLGQFLLSILDSHLSTHSLQLRSTIRGFSLDLRLAALPEVIHHQETSLAALVKSLNLEVFEAAPDAWCAREELFNETGSFIVKATMLPSTIAQFAAQVRTLGGTSVTQATGIMTASIPLAASSRLLHFRQQVEGAGGSVTVLQQPRGAGLSTWGTPPDTLPLMRELKHHFDPNRILNPARFLGDI